MKFISIFILLNVLPILSIQAQTHSGFSLGVSGSFSPDLQFYDGTFTNSQTLNFQASYFNEDYTRIEYGFQYARGFDSSVSYVTGLSAAAVFQISDQIRFKPGIGVQEFKMADRSCRTTWRTILDSVFDVSNSCSDDVHASFIGFTTLEYQLREPASIFLQATYRTMLSSVRRETGTEIITGPGGSSIERTNYNSDKSFYSSGVSFGVGIRFYLW